MSIWKSPPDNASMRMLKFFLLGTLAVGAGASLITEPNIGTWYESLRHPAITPPNYVFAPVWTFLYIMMALAAWRVWRSTGLKSVEMAVFFVQLAVNFAWSAIFFGLHRIDAAFIVALALDVSAAAAMILFFRKDRWAGLMMTPYLAWVLFASQLTHEFQRLN